MRVKNNSLLSRGLPSIISFSGTRIGCQVSFKEAVKHSELFLSFFLLSFFLFAFFIRDVTVVGSRAGEQLCASAACL